MRTGLSISIGIHVAVFAFAWFGLPELRNDDILPEQLVIVDMVDISEVTNTPTAAVEPEKAEEPKPEEPEPEAPKPAPPPPPKAAAPPPPPPPAPTPEPAPKPVAEVPEPEPAPAPKPAPEKAPEPEKVAQAPAPAPKPRPKPRAPEPKPEEAKKKPKKDDKKLDFSRLLKTLEKVEPQPQAKPEEETPKKKKADPLKDVLAKLQAPARSRSDKAFDPENKVSISEIDAVRRQIAQCWNVPAGAKDAEDLYIEIALQMGADGTVRDARIVDQTRLSRDGFFRSAAESARRAVLSCGKLPLPPEKYESWKNITMTFNPRDLL
ncbi:cell envelope integrity protein TolA [Nisaea nitritireducens]|uniref:cell envelope integrity protein TolA n=1 Tax=Nisaea nitritireducens TaxID=568392 RepID=UPI0018682457|nr:cell envelope integrity protein TolA [Nisaea nitritireducens]